MAVQQERIQLDIQVTDETRSFAKALRETGNLRNEFKEAEKEVRKNAKAVQELEKDLVAAAKAKKDTVEIEKQLIAERDKLTASTAKLNNALKQTVESGKGFQNIDLSNVAPRQLEQRLTQINNILRTLPAAIRASSPEAQALVREHQAIEAQMVAQKKALKGVQDATKAVERDTLGFLGRLVIGVMAAQRAFSILMQPSQLASEIESTKISLETMLSSRIKAQKLINEVIQLAKDTPFETKPLVAYTKQLVNVGIETSKIIPTLKNLGNVASGAGIENMQRIVTTYSQVASLGKLQGDNLKEFQQQNVPMLKTLTEVLKVSETEVLKRIHDGNLKFESVEKAFAKMTAAGGMFFNLMQKQSQTVEGLSSTLKDNYALSMAAFGDGLNDKLKLVLKSLIDFQGGLDTKQLREWGAKVGDVVIFLKDMIPPVTKVIALWLTFKTVMAISNTLDAVRTAWTNMSTAFSNAPSIIEGFKGMYKALLGVKTAQEGVNTAAKANPYGAMIAVLIAAGEAAYFLYEHLNQLSASQIAVQDSLKALTASTRESIQTSTDLFAIAKDVNATEKQRHDAMLKILHEYPQYLGDIKNEAQLKAQLEKAQQRVNEKIFEEGMARVKAAKLQVMAAQLVDEQMKLSAAEKLPGGLVVYEDGTREVVNTKADALRANIEKMSKTTAEFAKVFDKDAKTVWQEHFKNIKTSFSIQNEELTELYAQLKIADQTGNKELQKEIQNRITELKNQKDKTYADLSDIDKVTKKKEEISEKAQKKAQKDAKDAVKHLNDLRKIANDEAILQFDAQSVELAARYQSREITKTDFDKQDIALEIQKQEAIVKVQDSYLNRFQKHSKEWVDVQHDRLKALENIEKAKEKADKQLNDARKQEEEAEVFEFEKQGIEYDIMLAKHQISKEEHAKRELSIEIEKNRALIEINQKFLSQFKVGSKEYLAVQRNLLQEEAKMADAFVKLRPEIKPLGPLTTQYGAKTDIQDKDSLNTRLHNAVEAGLKIEKDKNAQGKSIFGTDFEISEKDGQILDKKVRMVLNKALELEIKKDAIQIRMLQKEMEVNQKGSDAYEKAAKEKEKLDNQQLKNKERLHAFEQKMLAQGKQALTDGLQLTIDILGKDAKARKENADKIKLIQSAQVIISGIAEVQKLWAGYADMPIVGQIIAGVLTAVAVGRTAYAVDKIQTTEYYHGGYTHTGSDQTAKPVYVHGNEWVAPAWQVRHPQYRPMIDALEMGRIRGYAQGGYINTTPTVSTVPTFYQSNTNDKMMQTFIGEISGLRNDVANWNTNLSATVVRDDIEKQAKQDMMTQERASL
jgi:tape measure domain-containing protein